MLSNASDVAARAGALLDDPSNSIYTQAYLQPFIDQCYAVLDVELESAGMQYVEAVVKFPVAARTSDLSPYMEDGQPLGTMKFPKRVYWKLPQDPDYFFDNNQSAFTNQVNESDLTSSIGATEWSFVGGGLQVTASSVDMILKVAYDQTSTTVYDPAANVIRGTAHILALRVAAEASGTRKGMEKRTDKLEMKAQKAWNQFKSLLVKNNQGQDITAMSTHQSSPNLIPRAAGYL